MSREVLQVFWCHPTTTTAARRTAASKKSYFSFLESIRANVRCPAGWAVLNRAEIFAFSSADGKSGLRATDTAISFSERVDEKSILHRQDFQPGWHPNAVHLEWQPFSEPDAPVSFDTLCAFAHAISECYSLLPTTRGDIDIRFLTSFSGSHFPPPQPRSILGNKRDYFATVARAMLRGPAAGRDDDGPAAGREKYIPSQFVGKRLASGWQLTAAQDLDPRFMHVIVSEGGGHGTHTFGALMKFFYDACYVYLPYLTSPIKLGACMRGLGASMQRAPTLVVRLRIYNEDEDEEERSLSVSDVAMFLEEWRDAAGPKRVLLLVSTRGGSLTDVDRAFLSPDKWRAWTFDAPGHTAGLVPFLMNET